MREEKKERLFSMLEYPFDYEEYIQKRLREIGDLEERRFAKTILLDGMLKMIQGMEQKYQNLEHRIYEEIKITDSLYHAVITIVKKEHYDPVNDTLLFEGWVAIRMVQSETKRSLDYGYPLLTNYKKDSFFRRYAQSSQVNLMTKADLLRRITELDLGEFIEVTDYNISSATQDFPVKQGMNWFVMFEWVPMDCRRVLLFTFRKKKEHFLNDSMMMYAISQMQLEISEFRCVGVFTEA